MHRAFAALLVAVVAGFASIGFAQEKAEIRIEPAELFPGDLARIAPHLDLAGSGCVKTSFVGNKSFAPEVDIWRNGKSETIRLGSSDPHVAAHVSFSLREVRDDKNEPKYRLIVASGGSTHSRDFDLPKVKNSIGKTGLALSKETTANDDEPVTVWILTEGEGANTVTADESFEARARRAEWAMVLKIRFGKSKFK